MSTINQTIQNENRRSTASNTEKLLLDLYEMALLCPDWEDLDPTTRANMFNEIRAMIELKRKISESVTELATAN